MSNGTYNTNGLEQQFGMYSYDGTLACDGTVLLIYICDLFVSPFYSWYGHE
jgi:hypothetical protein